MDIVLNAIQTYQQTNGLKIDGIVTFDEYAVLTTAAIASHYNLPGLSPDTVDLVKHKYSFREVTSKSVELSPKCVLLAEADLGAPSDALIASIEDIGFPCVIKPVAGAGSNFVRRIMSPADALSVARQYYSDAHATGAGQHWCLGPNRAPAWFMLEEMLVGQEVDMDLVVERGTILFMGIADNRPSEGPAELFMEAGGDQPSLLPAPQQERLRDLARKVISAYGEGLTGVFHLEAICGDKGAGAVELNLRLGGSEVLSMVLQVYGVHLGIQAAKLAMGLPIGPLNETPLTQCSSVNVLAATSGLVTRAGVDKDVWSVDGAVGAQVRSAPGRTLMAPPHGFDYIGWAVGQGKGLGDVDGARASVAAVAKMLVCDIDPLKIEPVL